MFIRLCTLPKIVLHIVIRLNKRMAATIEKENKIKVRWNSNDPDYVRALPQYFKHKRKEVLVAAACNSFVYLFVNMLNTLCFLPFFRWTSSG